MPIVSAPPIASGVPVHPTILGRTNVQSVLSTLIGRTTVSDIDYLAAYTDNIIAITALSASHIITLPAPTAATVSQLFKIKDESGLAGTYNIVIVAASGNIDGVGSIIIGVNYDYATLYHDGTDYFTI